MIAGSRVLGLITARGGSKGLGRKNIAALAGRPLIQWTISAALDSEYIDAVIVTTDDEEIAAASRQAGALVPFMRPAELASDDATSVEVVNHALQTIEDSFDLLVLLQPTSPLRISADIDSCIEKCLVNGDSCVACSEVSKHPYWMYYLSDSDVMEPVLPRREGVHQRQQVAPVYAVNGAVYTIFIEVFQKQQSFVTSSTQAYVMPVERSVDIDSAADLKTAEKLLDIASDA